MDYTPISRGTNHPACLATDAGVDPRTLIMGRALGPGAGMHGDAGGAQRVDRVQIDGLTLMKILKHARENPHDSASGPLLGLVVNHTLEVTNCFPLPPVSTNAAGEEDDGAATFQLDMLRCLREVNVDHLQVGHPPPEPPLLAPSHTPATRRDVRAA